MKIFCIGLNKTGTRSLHDALRRLGFRSVHWGGEGGLDATVARGRAIRLAVEQAVQDGRPLLEDLEEADAYSDIAALSERFDVLDQQYPGSKFILTTRDLEAWLDSRQRHVETNIERHERGEYSGTFLVVDRSAWAAEMTAHTTRVLDHFEDRPGDLLVMDISAGDGWERLCPFLGVDVPDEPFPRRG